ncbi:RNA polymerase-binding protein [Citrobacter phage CkP1]|nr:RNA polymerase-binding protein [Citrobacter phage CkP1]
MNLNFVDVKDIQPKNVRTDSNPNNQNKIRRAWVLMLPEEIKEAIKRKLPDAEVRFAYYASVDNSVSEKWIENMKAHHDRSIKSGAKIILDRVGGERLEDDFCVNADTHLVNAAEVVAEEIYTSFLPFVVKSESQIELN